MAAVMLLLRSQGRLSEAEDEAQGHRQRGHTRFSMGQLRPAYFSLSSSLTGGEA